MALGLRAKYGKALDDYWENYASILGDIQLTKSFMELLQTGQLKQAEEQLKDLHLYIRAKHYILGDKAPKHWKKFAKLALFITEKPYWD